MSLVYVYTVLFNPVFTIDSDILLLTLELKGLIHNYESGFHQSHQSLPTFSSQWLLLVSQ